MGAMCRANRTFFVHVNGPEAMARLGAFALRHAHALNAKLVCHECDAGILATRTDVMSMASASRKSFYLAGISLASCPSVLRRRLR